MDTYSNMRMIPKSRISSLNLFKYVCTYIPTYVWRYENTSFNSLYFMNCFRSAFIEEMIKKKWKIKLKRHIAESTLSRI